MSGRIVRPEKKANLGLPRIGMIKTGFKDPNGYPKSVDYFIPTGRYESYFKNAYGDKPSVIQVVFLDDDPNKVCDEHYEIRDKDGKLYARGDGETFEVWNGENYQTLTVEEYPTLMQAVQKRALSKKGWEVTLTLRFIVPKISGVLGYWQFSTKGEASSIPSITETFDLVKNQKGFIKGIIFDLSVQFATSQKPNTKSRYPVVSLIPNHSQENLELVKKHVIGFESKNLLE